jgi:dihydrofolate reductase
MSQRRILIAAVADNRVIGLGDTLPWHLPDDWAMFRARTAGFPFLMGRASYQSPDALLSDRRNVVLSRQTDLPLGAKCIQADSVEAAWQLLADEPVVFVLGGAQVFEATLPTATHLWLTHVHATPVGDAFFPVVDWSAWRKVAETPHAADAQHAHAFTFADYERVIFS